MLNLLPWLAVVLFVIGLTGVVTRRNALVVLMYFELMLNGVNLALVWASCSHVDVEGGILTFLIFIVAAAEMAVAIPVVLLLIRQKGSLDVTEYSNLRDGP